MAWGDDVLPLQERQQTLTDEVKLEDVYNTERHLLCVAGTRAHDHLVVSSTAPASEFLPILFASAVTAQLNSSGKQTLMWRRGCF